jgi:hypothetical protein
MVARRMRATGRDAWLRRLDGALWKRIQHVASGLAESET